MSSVSSLFAAAGSQSVSAGVSWGNRFVRTVNALAYGNGVYVAAGEGFVDTSVDGRSWSPRAAVGDSIKPSAALWSGSQFLLVGENNTIRTSPDGITWASRTSGAGGSQIWYGAAYGSSKFVVVGAGGLIVTSADGVTWTARTSGTTAPINDIVWNGSKFVAVCSGSSGSGPVLTSPDGVTWTVYNSGVSYGFSTVAWGNSLFVATNSGVFYSSPDGVTWTSRSAPLAYSFNRVIWANNRFIAVGDQIIFGVMATSPDGITWTDRTANASVFAPGIMPFGAYPAALLDVVWNGGSYFAAGAVGCALTSADSTTWTPLTTTPWSASTVTYGAGRFVMFSGNNVSTSVDGQSWTFSAGVVGNTQNSVTWSGSKFVSVGASGSIYTSSNGSVWTARTSGTSYDFNSVTWGGSQFVAVGNSGIIYTSPDGITWTSRSSGTTSTLFTVSWGGGMFVIGASAGGRFSSPDGVTWTGRGLVGPGYPDFMGSAWNGSVFAMVGLSSSIYTSPDGITWTPRTPPTTGQNLTRIAWGNGLFIVIGTTVISSPNGVTWSTVSTPKPTPENGIVFGNSTFVAVNGSGDILESPPPNVLTF